MIVIPQPLRELAPDNLLNHRSQRFDGTGFEVPLARFSPSDVHILKRIYAAVQELGLLLQRMSHAPEYPALEAYVRGLDTNALLVDAGRIANEAIDPAVRKAAHDIRGGGLSVLTGTSGLLDIIPGTPELLRKCAEAARDHAKIMRSLVPDLDPEVRALDEADKAHDIGHFVDKWHGAVIKCREKSVAVRVHCGFRGMVSARCLETSSVDRVLYNYVNNAVRFAEDGQVDLWIFLTAQGLTRWVVSNPITPANAAYLRTAVSDLARLYAGGVTQGGTGIGLLNCAELVADCFGLESPVDAVNRGYLGAALHGNDYRAWFHWPVFQPSL